MHFHFLEVHFSYTYFVSAPLQVALLFPQYELGKNRIVNVAVKESTSRQSTFDEPSTSYFIANDTVFQVEIPYSPFSQGILAKVPEKSAQSGRHVYKV